MTLLLRNVEVHGRPDRSLLVDAGSVREMGPSDVVGRGADPDQVIDGGGGVLLPGLHDHHIHLFALAALQDSLWCGPPAVTGAESLVDALRSASRSRRDHDWLRGVGWDDTVIGWPDRHDLDGAVADRPIRLQHRSGALWVLNSAALARLDLDLAPSLPPGLELDRTGEPTGRLFGVDAWLADRLGGGPPDLSEIGGGLAAHGVTGVTDATAHNGVTELDEFARQHLDGRLPQRITAMTAPEVDHRPDGITVGPVKIVLAERDLPDRRDLVHTIMTAHEHHRPVAIHAASRPTVVYAITALADAGRRSQDRIEHASVVPPELVRPLARLGATVVTQHHFLAEHGDRYHRTVEPADRPWLYRGRAFVDNGIPLAAGSDAPVGDPDPFATMRAAVERTTSEGRVLEPGEALEPEEALALFTGSPDDPGGRPRRVRVGSAADLCLLDRPWADARRRPDRRMVRATIIDGRLVYDRERDR
jgi:predicted amidohydrolase YtcJ